MKSISHRVCASALFSSFLLLQACASAVVSDANRDTIGLYDGIWKATVLKPAALQYIGNWNVTCDAAEFDFRMRIDSGKVYIGTPGTNSTTSTNISKKGNFLFDIPLQEQATTSAQSSSTLADARRKIIFRGNLAKKKPTGSYTVGIADLGWQGCFTRVVFSQLSDSQTVVES